MSNVSLIEVGDRKWNGTVRQSFEYDFYHTADYHLLENGGRPLLFVVTVEDVFVALPMLIRRIAGTDFFDFTSAYGYCGPVSNKVLSDIPVAHIKEFQKELIDFCHREKIITGFSRLHPLISSDLVFDDFGEINPINKTVAIDLQISPDEQKKQYRKSNKSELNQLRRKGFTVETAASKSEVDEFIEIYLETMRRVSAADSYMFTHDYFHSFLNSESFQSRLLLAKHEGRIAAGAIFTITGKIMQYHLAGTREQYIRATPMKLILDEARLIGNSLNLDFLHLGGGVGGSDEDSLFRFKAGFSDFRCEYKIWKIVIDLEQYQKLTKNMDSSGKYFPLYRGPSDIAKKRPE